MTGRLLPLAPGRRRGLGTAAVFAAAFAGSCWLAARWLPFPEVINVAQKRAHLAAHGDDYDAIFLGSSRVEFQVIPALFDQRMAELGFPIRSFNAGISGMTPPEDAFLFDQIARGPHRRLRWVFIELDYPRLKTQRALWDGGRMTYWHDAERMQIMGRCFLAEWAQTQARLAGQSQPARPWSERLQIRLDPVADLLEHFTGFLHRQTNLGRGAALASRLVKRKKTNPLVPDKSTADQGWVRLDGGLEDKNRAAYERAYAERLVTPQTARPNDPAAGAALRRLVEKVTAIGALPVFLVPPTTARTQMMPPEDLRQCRLLNFSDVRAFPELFVPGHRLDVEHLNAEGAPPYSRLLAERFFASLHTEKESRP